MDLQSRRGGRSGSGEPQVAGVSITIVSATDVAIDQAADALRAGGLIGLPTETVYGLAADATNAEAVASIFATKGRPSFNPLISHITDVAEADRLATLSDRARRLAETFWPGPLTLVLPRRVDCPLAPAVTAGLATVAVRAPSHRVARALLLRFGSPLAAPSANRSGRVSPTTARHVEEEFGADLSILDGGPCVIGLESTVVSLAGERPTLLRPGGVSEEALLECLDGDLDRAGPTAPIAAPGMLASHYAPRARVRTNARARAPGEAYLGFGGTIGADLDLSRTGDLAEAAAHLFAHLRRLDQGTECIAVAPIPDCGLGRAINDRLRRAAAPR